MSESNDAGVPPPDAPAPVPDPPKLAEAKVRYADFLAKNPLSSIVHFADDEIERLFVHKPWGDRSLALIVPDDDAAFAEALNTVYLPPRYTAIYHTDLRALEVIWTAYKLDEEQRELEDRKFNLQLPSGIHACEFSGSSERLLEMARHVLTVEISDTVFRNLMSFSSLDRAKKNNKDEQELDSFGKPLSFWIYDLDWNDDYVINLIRHVNFYLRYYDARSPTVEIHPASDYKMAPKTRYFEGFNFPTDIVSPALDTKLMILYSAATGSAAVSNNFLNLYRVIEYVSQDFSHNHVRKEIKDIVSKPHALHDVSRVAADLLAIFQKVKAERDQEIVPRFFRDVIKPADLWRELEPNRGAFTAKTDFEGGMSIPAIFGDKVTAETFGLNDVEQFARQCTKIRNGLAHGRDKANADSILPTSRNFDLLRPWVNALLACAGEVVLYAARH